MKIGFLKSMYPRLNAARKNVTWRNLTDAELDRSMKQPQIVSNCFEEATRYALLASKKGREYIKDRIKIQKNAEIEPAYKCKLHINGKDESFRATKNDYFCKYKDVYEQYKNSAQGCQNFYDYSNSRLSLGVNICIGKMIKKHPSMKPFICRLSGFGIFNNRRFEFNKPSNAFEWFTGKKPISIGETDLNFNLKKHKKEVCELFDKLSEKGAENYSFVVLTGQNGYRGISHWHTMPILDINKSKNQVKTYNTRTCQEVIYTYDEIINHFKAVIGLEHK